MQPTNVPVSIFWFRRDLRLEDNAGLYHALTSGHQVLPIFIFDDSILNQFEKPFNRQVCFIYDRVWKLKEELRALGSDLLIAHAADAMSFYEKLTENYNIAAVYTNEDYELQAMRRDEAVATLLREKGVSFHSYKDQVIFAKDEVVKDNGQPYTVFTPYSRKWLQRLSEVGITDYNCKALFGNFYRFTNDDTPTLNDLGFQPCDITIPSLTICDDTICQYDKLRDYPALDATSHLGVHLRFGTISIRKLLRDASPLNKIYVNELIWREFYHAITYHFPHVCEGKSFKREYDAIAWRNNEAEFAAWCSGQTGYPMVDAGMRQLNETGYMHNRARMIAASFLIKHLLIDWRWGEAYFANQLLDFDFAANNGGWQWAASCGCDAVPYFRIFNPALQADKFDKSQQYIRRWIPEIGTKKYPIPIVDHNLARERVLKAYKAIM